MRRPILLLLVTYLLPLVSLAQLDFGYAEFPDVGHFPKRLTIGDFDGDGKEDVAYNTYPNTGFHINYGEASHVFEHKVFDLGGTLFSDPHVKAGDLNNDGKDDLININNFGWSLNPRPDELVIGISNGRDFIKKSIEIPYNSLGPFIFDFDDDGDLDVIATLLGETTRVYKNDSQGNFTLEILDGVQSPTIYFVHCFGTDLNKDGRNDIVFFVDKKILVYTKNSGDGYSKQEIITTYNPRSVTCADFSGDGYPDFVVAAQTLRYLVNDGLGSLMNAITIPIRASTFFGIDHRDYDKDGKEDVLVGVNDVRGALLLRNLGNGNFEDKSPTDLTVAGGDLAFADVSGDGIAEIVPIDQFSWSVFGLIGGDYSSEYRQITGATCGDTKLYDLNNDGHKDLIAATRGNDIAIWYGSNTGFKSPQFIPAERALESIGVADFNSDGFGDIVYIYNAFNGQGNKTKIILSDNGPNLKPAVSVEGNLQLAITADFNNDGKMDIASYRRVLSGNGDGTFILKESTNFPQAHGGWVAKLNNDNFPDLVLYDNSKTWLGINDGAGDFLPFTELTLPNGSIPKAVIDINGDGLPDIVTAVLGPGGQVNNITLFFNKGNLQFEDSQHLTVPTDYYVGPVAVADVNGDGYLDIAGHYLLYGDYINIQSGIAFFAGNASGVYGEYALFNGAKTTDSNLAIYDSQSLEFTHINSDNRIDAVFTSANLPGVAVMLNDEITPPINAPSNISIVPTRNSASVTLEKGSGSGRILIIKKGSATDGVPLDGTFYIPNPSSLALASVINTDNFVAMRSNETSVNITGLNTGTTYTITAFEYSSNSKNTIINYLTSSSVSKTFTTLKDQTITFTPVTPKTFGEGTTTVTATSTSGLAVTLSIVSGSATIAGNIVTPTAAGSITLKAIQSGNNEYSPATPVEYSFCVNPLKPTIVLSKEPDGTYVLASSSSTNNTWFRNDVMIANATGNTLKTTEIGSYTVKVTKDNCSNTSAATSILKSQTISFDPVFAKPFGEGTFTITAKSTSSLAVNLVIKSGPGTILGNVVTPNGAGRITVTGTQTGNSEYEAADPVDFSFCVNPMKPTVTSLQNNGKFILTSSSDTDNTWYKSGTPISGATSKTFETTEDGVYKVRVAKGDCSNFSDEVSVVITGLEDQWQQLFTIYPNPVSALATITYPADFIPSGNPVIYNSVGSLFEPKVTTIEHGFEMNTESLQPGLYIIRLRGSKPVNIKMLKK